VRYIPDWERLADALKRVMETGTSEEEAKTDLCRAVADRKIHVRASIRSGVFSNGNVRVPPHLRPEDLDWTQSRPFGPWWIGPKLGQHYWWDPQKRSLDLIELSTSDVITILCGAGTVVATVRQETAAIMVLASHFKSNPQTTRAEAADWCREHGYNLGKRAFDRVWAEARERAGLERIAAPGRKGKSPR